MNAESYARMLKKLLPPGRLWKLVQDSWISKVFLAIGDELARVHARAQDLLLESDPRTATEMLDEWEEFLGLPDDCDSPGSMTTTERRNAATQKLVSRGGQTPQFYIDLAAAFGVPGVTIDEFQYPVMRSGFRSGARCYGIQWAYVWTVNIPGTSNPGLECRIERAKPAHTIVLFNYI